MFERLPEVRDGFDDALPWWVEEDDPELNELPAVAQRAVGPWLVTGLLGIDRSALSPDEALTYLQQWERAVAWASGMQARATADAFAVLLAGQPEPEGAGSQFVIPEAAASAEAAAALRIAPRTADERIFQALDLTGPMALLHDALLDGSLSLQHVSMVRRELLRLPAAGNPDRADEYTAQCADVLATVVPFAKTHTPGQSAKKARMLVSAVDPEGTRDRRREAAERLHGVFLRETEPGTCELTAIMPTTHGHAVLTAINTLAKDDRFETADGCVTIGQRRVAAFVELTLGAPGTVHEVTGPVHAAKIRADISVVVPLATAMAAQADAQGGTINGEAVPADALWELLAEASSDSTLRKLVVDDKGCILDAGRTRYAISETQRRLIELRDQHCRFPGCSRPAERCDIDHATAYKDGGKTDLDNCGPLCRRHHQMKTHGRWRIIRSQRNGACTWRSPLGRIYEHTPPDLLPPPPRPLAQVTADSPPPF